MQNQAKLARAGLALCIALVPGMLAMQGCVTLASSTAVPDPAPVVAETLIEDEETPLGQIGAGLRGDEGATAYQDGVYTASAEGKCGDVPVTVTIEGARIVRITIGDNVESPAMVQKARQTVVPEIIEEQSADDIDVASGATATSNAIIAAVGDALRRASL